MSKIIMLHATVSGKTWSGHRCTLEVTHTLRRDKPLRVELATLLRSQGDFDGGAKSFTEDSFITITNRRGNKTKMVDIGLTQLPSIKPLMVQ